VTESLNEPGQRCYDSDADVVVAATPDLTGRYDGTRVWRETKSTVHELPDDEADAIDIYLAAALDLVLLAALTAGSPALVELEVLTPDDSRVYALPTDDQVLLTRARQRVAAAALDWHTDTGFEVRPGRHCAWCPVAHFCPARRLLSHEPVGNFLSHLGSNVRPSVYLRRIRWQIDEMGASRTFLTSTAASSRGVATTAAPGAKKPAMPARRARQTATGPRSSDALGAAPQRARRRWTERPSRARLDWHSRSETASDVVVPSPAFLVDMEGGAVG
jgi:hypothetical protein